MGNVSSVSAVPAFSSTGKKFQLQSLTASTTANPIPIRFDFKSDKTIRVSRPNHHDVLLVSDSFDLTTTSFSSSRSLSIVLNENTGNESSLSATSISVDYDPEMRLTFQFAIEGSSMKGLTFVNVSSPVDLDDVLKVKFKSNPNIHRFPFVSVVEPTLLTSSGDNQNLKIYEWNWKYVPPPVSLSKDNYVEGLGWKNFCSFVEYSAKDNVFYCLASFTFWTLSALPLNLQMVKLQSASDLPDMGQRSASFRNRSQSNTIDQSPVIETQSSVDNIILDESQPSSSDESPMIAAEKNVLSETSFNISSNIHHERELSNPSNAASSPSSAAPLHSNSSAFDLAEIEDGPLFRATIHTMEKKTSNLKTILKKAIKQATSYVEATKTAMDADKKFIDFLAEIPNLESGIVDYLLTTQSIIQAAQENYVNQIQTLLVDPLSRLYENDVKASEAKKKDFDQESSEYYIFLSKYLSVKSDENAKKKAESDSKYLVKRKAFDLKRFDYYTLLHDLHGGQKDQEMSFILTNFASKQVAFYHHVAHKLDETKPALEKLTSHVSEGTKNMHMLRKEREERRRTLEIKWAGDSTQASENSPAPDTPGPFDFSDPNSPAVSNNLRFKGIRDLDQGHDPDASGLGRKKEGFLFAATVNSINMNATVKSSSGHTAWRKLWCVVSNGHLHEYSHWKKQLEVSSTINLRFCTVREARNCDRRFCFELIGPQLGKRLYQATDDQEMRGWCTVIQNAIEGLLSGTSSYVDLGVLLQDSQDDPTTKKGHHSGTRRLGNPSATNLSPLPAMNENDPNARKILEILRDVDPGNLFCADCGAKGPDWASINLGSLICIECSGIHRSLGTHITKVRSITLDVTSWTPELIAVMKLLGNTKCNIVWEANVPSSYSKPSPIDRREIKLTWIKEKYQNRTFVDKSMTNSNILAFDYITKGIIAKDLLAISKGIAAGADLNYQPSAAPLHTSLHVAFGYPYSPPKSNVKGLGLEELPRFICAEFILQNGGNVSIIDESLMETSAGFKGNPRDIIFFDGKRLITDKTMAKVNLKRSVLHYAVLFHDVEAVSYLVGKGADPTIKDAFDKSPIDLVELVRSWWQQHPPNNEEEKAELSACESKLMDALAKWGRYSSGHEKSLSSIK